VPTIIKYITVKTANMVNDVLGLMSASDDNINIMRYAVQIA
jgi:hypothetical protein